MHYSDFDLFKTAIHATCRSEGFHMILNTGREVLEQTGTGHFVPVGGFSCEDDRALLLDTARFKYPPHWVKLDLLYESICTRDTDTNQLRGFVILTRTPDRCQKLSLTEALNRPPLLPKTELKELVLESSGKKSSPLASLMHFFD